MATTTKKAGRPSTKPKVENKVVEEVKETIVEEVIETETIVEDKPKKRKFSADEEIACVSLFPGQYFVEGGRSKDLYTFAALDDIQYIRYDDLDYMIKRKYPCVFMPRFIIQDEDFLELYPNIAELYGSLYTSADLKKILGMTPNEIKNKIPTLPLGAQEALKVLAMSEIDKGRFDSLNRIKALDEIFGTEMASKLAGN